MLGSAPAKLNLRLVVLAREAGGYHQIETVLCRIELADLLEIEAGGSGVRLDVEGAETGPVEDNLVVLAAQAFARVTGLDDGVRVRLVKHIPAGAGLGGGSSDAAAMLRALNELHGRPLAPRALLELARSLGSDVPFFVAGAAFALAWGRGDRLLPLPAPPAAELVLIVPPDRIATADAYAALGPIVAPPALLRPRDFGSWAAIAHMRRNDFEAGAAARHASISAALDCARQDAVLSGLTGTGSAVFAVFDNAAAADAAAEHAREMLPSHAVLRSRSAVDRPAPAD